MEKNEETLTALNKAILLAKEGNPSAEKLSQLGDGWIGEEALSIAIYCALPYPENFEKALKLSVNHSGDSDSTESICGNISETESFTYVQKRLTNIIKRNILKRKTQ